MVLFPGVSKGWHSPSGVDTNAVDIDTNAVDIDTNAVGVDTNAVGVDTNAVGIDTDAVDVDTDAVDVDANAVEGDTNAADVDAERRRARSVCRRARSLANGRRAFVDGRLARIDEPFEVTRDAWRKIAEPAPVIDGGRGFIDERFAVVRDRESVVDLRLGLIVHRSAMKRDGGRVVTGGASVAVLPGALNVPRVALADSLFAVAATTTRIIRPGACDHGAMRAGAATREVVAKIRRPCSLSS